MPKLIQDKFNRLAYFRISPVKLIITGFLFYLFLAIFVNKPFIGSDGRSYQRMAINMAEGNGYSNSIKPPFERQFFREPGYPFFFSLACKINTMIGNENIPLAYEEINPGYFDGTHDEILILRILQAILASISLWLFYKILLFFIQPGIAGIISFLLIFYLPFSIFITFPQREILVTTLLMGMGYLFLKSSSCSKPSWYDLAFGVCAAALVLTLQAYVFILPFFLMSHIAVLKNLEKSLRSMAIISVVFISGVAPWIYRGYMEAMDLKVIKTFGISYTYEFKRFHDANAMAYKFNLNNEKETFRQNIIKGYEESGEVMFDKSFNGYYLNYTDSLKKVIKSTVNYSPFEWTKYYVADIIKVNYRKAIFWPLWEHDYRKSLSAQLNEKEGKMIIPIIFGLIVGLLALFGMLMFIRKTWYFLPVFIFHFIMIPVMADEARRVLPFLPFLFMFFILSIFYIINFSREKLNLNKISLFK